MNSAYWGQSDAIFTCFLLGCIFSLMQGQPLLAMISWGISFSFKAQAAFLGPLILLLIVKKKIPWYYVGIVPLVYGIAMIPAAFAGRPLLELLTIYFGQADTYQMLSMNAPNLFLLFPNIRYEAGLIIGLIITALIILAWIIVYARRIKEFTPAVILVCALAAVAYMPFFLPKMHDRYFYLAEVLSFLAAFYFLQGWPLAVGYQIVSGLVYFVFLRSSLSMTRMPGSSDVNILMLAAVINTLLIGFVFWKQWKLIGSEQENYLNSDTLKNDT
jgi:Gpi18-like mannosyltransferase